MTVSTVTSAAPGRSGRRRPRGGFPFALALAGLAGAAPAAPPAVDNSSSTSADEVNQITVSHTTAGADRLMLVGVGWDVQGNPDITGVTYNGASLALVGAHQAGAEVRIEIWRLVAPALGTADVVVDFDNTIKKGAVVGVMTFTGVDQATPLGTYAGDSGTGSTAAVNVAAAVDELVFAVVCNETQNMTVGPGQTEYWNIDTGEAQGAGGTKPGNGGTVNVSWTLSSDAYAIGAVPIKPGGATISSAANQVFATGDPATASSTITVTDGPGAATITAASDLRIRIPADFNMRWETADTTATIGGTASAKVASAVSYEDAGRTLVLDVTSDFSGGQSVTIADLSFTDFVLVSAADNLELEVHNDDAVTATDDKTIEIGGANVVYRSIGTAAAPIYSAGDASVTTGSLVVTFTGATLPTNVGLGDTLTIGSGGPATLFSDDFNDSVITGWTNIGADSLSESSGALHASSSTDDSHYRVTAGAGWTDYTVTCDIMAKDNDDTGITFRVQDANNYYVLYQRFGNPGAGDWDLSLEKYVGGTPTDVAPPIDNQGAAPGQVDSEDVWYTLKVEVNGDRIKCYLDDVLKFDVFDSTFADGSAGVWCLSQACRFDNMLVTSPTTSELHILARDSDTQVTVQVPAALTHTDESYTIARSYGTLQAWEDDRDGDLVAGSRREVGVCYNDGPFTGRLVIGGAATDATYYMRLTVADGQRHNGTPESGARIDPDGGWSSQNAIDVQDPYTRIEWLELTDVFDAGNGIVFSASADNGLVHGVFVNGFWPNDNAAVRAEASGVTIRNCIATGPSHGVWVSATGEAMIENCTFWGASNAGYGVHAVAACTVGVRNTICVDYGTLDMDISGGATITDFGYNMFSTWGGGFDPGSHAGGNQWPPTNLDHLFVDSGSDDLHLEISGNRAGNLGLDLSGVFADDVDGQSRAAAWDIGADEARPGTDPSTPKVMVWQEIER